MALPIKNFRGVLKGKTPYTYTKQLNYDLNTYDERNELLNKALKNDDFFVEYFDDFHKVNVNKEDYLSIDRNICKSIEKMADYLLFSPDKKEKRNTVKYIFYTEDKLNEKIKKEKSLQEIADKISFEEDKANYDEVIAYLVDKSLNYKKEYKQKIIEEDYHDKDLKDYFNECRTTIFYYKQLLDDKENKLSFKQRKTIMKLMSDIKYDMLIYKDKIKGTIYFKHLCNGSESPDTWLFNFTNEKHVASLLKCSRNDLSSDIGVLNNDLMQLLEQINLPDVEKEILRLWRTDEFTQEDIADKLGVEQQFVSSTIKKIINKIIKQYKENYEDWLYLNYLRGNYKICSSCGEIKLVQRFNKDSSRRDGFKYFCKKCESVDKN